MQHEGFPMRAVHCTMALVILMGAYGCRSSNPVGPGSFGSASSAIVVLKDPLTLPFPRDPATIRAARVSADTLTLVVLFGGGCKHHDFTLFARWGFVETFPCIAVVYLSHDAHGDLCRAMVTDTLAFTLDPLKQEYLDLYRREDTILLEIWEPSLKKSFSPLPVYDPW